MKHTFIIVISFVFILKGTALAGEPVQLSLTGNNDKVIHTREVYKTVDTFKLKIDIFYMNQSLEKENNTAIVFFHGGGWAFGTPNEFFATCERYARMGIVTYSVDYRLSIDNGVTPNKKISPIESVMDAKSAIRWVRENAAKFHVDGSKIIAAGQSAGGHLALCTAMIDDYNEKSDNRQISSRPDAILLYSACVNAVEGWCDRLLAARRNRIWSISPAHNIKGGMPPMIEFHGVYDEQVPVWTVQFFQNDMKKAGNYFELHTYEGRRHYLGEGNPEYSRYFDDEILKITDDFLRKNNFMN